MFSHIFLHPPKRPFPKFTSIFLSFSLPADSNPMLAFQWIYHSSSDYHMAGGGGADHPPPPSAAVEYASGPFVVYYTVT
jgi:hypothetical protein